MLVSRLLILLLGLALGAQAIERHGGDFLRIDMGAATVGRGSAGLVLAEEAVRAWWNPALLVKGQAGGIALQHQELFEGELRQDYLAWTGDWRGFPLGVYLLRQAIEDVPLVDGLVGGSFEEGGRPNASYETISDWILGIGSSLDLSPRLRAGLTLKLIHRDLAAYTGQGIGLDAGAWYGLRDDLELGLSLRDITGSIILWDDGEQDWIPPEVALGAAWRKDLPRLRSALAVELDLRSELEGRSPDRRGNWRRAWLHGGLEWSFLERFQLRGGMSEGDPAAGAGIQLGRLQADYAWRPHEDLGASHLVTLHLALP